MIGEWHHRQWCDLNPGLSLQQRLQKMQVYLDEAPIPKMLVAQRDGKPMGTAAIVHHDMDSRMDLSPWLASVYVAPAFRRTGIGSALVRAIGARAASSGEDRLYLFTPDQRGFYAALGWSVFTQEVYRGQPVDLMRLNLSQ